MNILRGTSSSVNDGASKFREFQQYYRQGREFLVRAVEIDEKCRDASKDYSSELLEACELYKKGIDEFKKAGKVNVMDVSTEHRKDVAEWKKKMETYLHSAEDRFMVLFNKLNTQSMAPVVKRFTSYQGATSNSSARTNSPAKRVGRTATTGPPVQKMIPSTNTPTKAKLLNGVDPKIGELLLNEMLVHSTTLLSDVCGCEAAKAALEEAVVLPALNPNLFTGLRQPVKGILLYGPPGNGKTMLAKAVANESGQNFFNISASTLMSKWVGDGEKTMRALFQVARNAQPCIIFIDEIDSILRERTEKDSEVSRRMKTEFLVQFDGASSSETDKILVIGATNRPQELDDAVLRRFPKRILLSLPDDAGRYILIKSILIKHGMFRGLQDSDIKYISSRTSGYSHADLVALCKEASMVPVRSIDKSKLSSTDSAKLRSLKASDFDKALTVIKPSSSSKHMDELYEFSKRNGG